MNWLYYLILLGLVLIGVFFCYYVFRKYKNIQQNGTKISGEIIDIYGVPSSMFSRIFNMDVVYMCEDAENTVSCSIRCLGRKAPVKYESMEFLYFPDKPDYIYPVKISENPVFLVTILIAALTVFIFVSLVATLISQMF